MDSIEKEVECRIRIDRYSIPPIPTRTAVIRMEIRMEMATLELPRFNLIIHLNSNIAMMNTSQFVQFPLLSPSLISVHPSRLLKNYKLAHERIELQRVQLVSQENQNAALREHIALLENGGEGNPVGGGVVGYTSGGGGTTIDDFTIRNHSSNLASRIHNWSGDSITNYIHSHDSTPSLALQERYPHLIPSDLLLIPLLKALLQDLGQEQVSSSPLLFALDKDGYGSIATLGIIVQSLLRHVMSEILAEAIINRLLITDSEQTNLELTKIHTILFDRTSHSHSS